MPAPADAVAFAAIPDSDRPWNQGTDTAVVLVTSFGAGRFRGRRMFNGGRSSIAVPKPGLVLEVKSYGLLTFLTPCCLAEYKGGAVWRTCSRCKERLLKSPELPLQAVGRRLNIGGVVREAQSWESAVEAWCAALSDPLEAVLATAVIMAEVRRQVIALDRNSTGGGALKVRLQEEATEKAARELERQRRHTFAQELAAIFKAKAIGGQAYEELAKFGELDGS